MFQAASYGYMAYGFIGGFNASSANPEKCVSGKTFFEKMERPVLVGYRYIYHQNHNHALGDLSGEEDKQKLEQGQH